jgi:hypothetical protein
MVSVSTCLGMLAGDSRAEVAAGTGLRQPDQALQLARLCSTSCIALSVTLTSHSASAFAVCLTDEYNRG